MSGHAAHSVSLSLQFNSFNASFSRQSLDERALNAFDKGGADFGKKPATALSPSLDDKNI